MSQELTPALEPKRKGTLGEQVRKIADQLQQDTELQIKGLFVTLYAKSTDKMPR